MFHNGKLVRYSLISLTSCLAKVGHITREVDDKKVLEDTKKERQPIVTMDSGCGKVSRNSSDRLFPQAATALDLRPHELLLLLPSVNNQTIVFNNYCFNNYCFEYHWLLISIVFSNCCYSTTSTIISFFEPYQWRVRVALQLEIVNGMHDKSTIWKHSAWTVGRDV